MLCAQLARADAQPLNLVLVDGLDQRLATAKLLHERGFQVMVTGQNLDTLAAADKELADDIVILQADSRSLTDSDRIAEEVRIRFGQLTTLFLNAGITRRALVPSVDEATYDELFAINTKGQFFTLQKTLPLLADGASIVFTVGVGVTRGRPGGSVTAGSRGALLAMVPSLAAELAPRRIRVNAVSPGAIQTPIWSKSEHPPRCSRRRWSRCPPQSPSADSAPHARSPR
jgi:NAD(P)-dependent dehydrogenase (short-subunit alcohol dehydrogenase family)